MACKVDACSAYFKHLCVLLPELCTNRREAGAHYGIGSRIGYYMISTCWDFQHCGTPLIRVVRSSTHCVELGTSMRTPES